MPEVCIMDQAILNLSRGLAEDLGGHTVETSESITSEFFMRRTAAVVPVERCHSIISKHGHKLGDHDFFFEWRETPEPSQIDNLIEKVDQALEPLGCLYTITTKRKAFF
jgi:hypothetical protein